VRAFPPFLLPGRSVRPLVLFRVKVKNNILADDLEKISFHFQWALDHDYSGMWRRGGAAVTATQLRFVLAEILGQRGPGSLFRLLQRRRWLPEGSRDQPWVSFLVDVSGFQVLAGARGDAGGVRPAGARVNCLPLKSSV